MPAPLSAIDLAHDGDGPVEQAMRREAAEVVREVCRSSLKGAPSRYLWMYAIDERNSTEIAERYHITRVAVCNAVRDAHARLRSSPRLRELAS
jgi:DNA-directed RNA polymerase specialized sigma subunit